MLTLCGFAPNQAPKYPCLVYWSDDLEHYLAECSKCEWNSAITWSRWQARRWALAHKCSGESASKKEDAPE